MPRYGQIVMGPAGSGKSTYCSAVCQHGEATRRRISVVNLDPAAENFAYTPIVDIRDIIHVDDVLEDSDIKLGPNGALVFCMEYLVDNLQLLQEALGDDDDDYIIFDCPGQIELYTHLPVMKSIVTLLQQTMNFHLCGVFILDTQFVLETPKFLSGCLVALSAMTALEIPFVSILSKMDLLNKDNKELVETYLQPEGFHLMDIEDSARNASEGSWDKKIRKLAKCLGNVLSDYSLVSLQALDITDEDSISDALGTIDTAIQYGEDADVKDRYPEEVDFEDANGGNGMIH